LKYEVYNKEKVNYKFIKKQKTILMEINKKVRWTAEELDMLNHAIETKQLDNKKTFESAAAALTSNFRTNGSKRTLSAIVNKYKTNKKIYYGGRRNEAIIGDRNVKPNNNNFLDLLANAAQQINIEPSQQQESHLVKQCEILTKKEELPPQIVASTTNSSTVSTLSTNNNLPLIEKHLNSIEEIWCSSDLSINLKKELSNLIGNKILQLN
jgi:hypothetical protein